MTARCGPRPLPGFLLAAAATLWPVGLPVLIVFLLYLAVRRVGWRAFGAAAAAGAIPVAGYVLWFHGHYGRYAFSNSDGIYLWSRTMTFANCAVIQPPKDQLVLCPRQPVAQRPAASTFIWEKSSPLNGVPGPKFSAHKNALALHFALRAIAAQPGSYLADVLHDVSLSFYWNNPDHPSRAMTQRYEFAYATSHWISPGYVLAPGRTVAFNQLSYGGATSTRAVEPFAGWMRGYQRFAYVRGTVVGSPAADWARRHRPVLARRRDPAARRLGRASSVSLADIRRPAACAGHDGGLLRALCADQCACGVLHGRARLRPVCPGGPSRAGHRDGGRWTGQGDGGGPGR